MFPSEELVRIVSLCVVLAGVETLHGIARTVLLAPKVGKAVALKLSVVTGTLLAFAVCYLWVPQVGLRGFASHLSLGMILAAFMAAFDVVLGKAAMRLKWSRIFQDFNPASGNYLSLGLLLLIFIPSLIWWLKGG